MVRSKTDDKIRALSTVGLFGACNKKELHAVARLCTPLPVQEGFVLTSEGTTGRECFIIAAGKAAVMVHGNRVGEVGPGQCVGEMALLDGGTRSATVTAETPMDAYVLSTREFRSLVEVNPTIIYKIAAALAHRLRAAESDQLHCTFPDPTKSTPQFAAMR
jgi:CRP-like cAMP-binding protein